MDKSWLFVLTFFALISTVIALECYTCEEQDRNNNKCKSTTKQCEQFQDACTSYVRWGIPPYWTPRGDRIYFISKNCDTMAGCEKRQAATYMTCKRDWYNDWACVECCSGDLCNYFVTLGAGSVTSSVSLVVGACLGLLGLRYMMQS